MRKTNLKISETAQDEICIDEVESPWKIAPLGDRADPEQSFSRHYTAGGHVGAIHEQIVESFELGLENSENYAFVTPVSHTHRLEAFVSAALGYACFFAALAGVIYIAM